jgi:hypothetical protein
VAYYDPGNTTLNYIEATDANGDTWGSPQSPVASLNIGQYASLANVSNQAGIAYLNAAGVGVIEYVDSASLGPPATWNPPVGVVGSAAGSRWFDSLIVLADGSPALVYYAPSVGAVRIRRATDATGDTWTAVSSIGNVVDHPLVVPRAIMVGDIAHAFWFDPDTNSLMHAAASDDTGLNWNAPEVVSGSVDGNIQCAPLPLNGYPAVGFALTSGKLRFAVEY